MSEDEINRIEMSEDEINMYTRVFTKEPQYGPRDDIDEPETVDKDEGDFRLIRDILESLLYSYSHQYQDKKDGMISNMTTIAKATGDLNIKRLIAYSVVFPRIMKEFNKVLLDELEERRRKKTSS